MKNVIKILFTEKTYKEHMGHHYVNPVDFLNYAFQNPKLELVFRFLCELTGGQLVR